MPLKFGFEPHWMDFRAPELNFSHLGVNLCLWGSIQGVNFGALWSREVDLTLVGTHFKISGCRVWSSESQL